MLRYILLNTKLRPSEYPFISTYFVCLFTDYPLINVRRRLYKPSTAAGKGIKWEWLSLLTSDWNSYNMDVQNTLENAFSKGIQSYDFQLSPLNLPYLINLNNMTETKQPNGPIKHIRRIQQAPYPLIKVSQDDQLFDLIDSLENMTLANRSPSKQMANIQIPPPLPPIKSKKIFANIGKMRPQMPLPNEQIPHSSQSLNTNTVNASNHHSSSAKFARQIFNNLNIFSHKPHQPSFYLDQTGHSSRSLEHINHVRRLSNKSNSSTASTQNLLTTRRCRKSYRSHEDDFYTETDGGSSCCSATTSSGVGSRRPSVDTISTYLSHDSTELLPFDENESTYVASDDDVFLPSVSHPKGTIVGVDADSDMISRFVSVVEPPKWPACRPCAMCLEELQHSPNNPVVSLVRCEHMMHLNCLNHLIVSQSQQQQQQQNEKCKSSSLFIECPVCGIVYGEKYGNQPPGTMTWSIIPKQLAGHEGQNTIQIVYKYKMKFHSSLYKKKYLIYLFICSIASGLQTHLHPHPGRSFFAVGFPRTTYLPDCPLGRKV